MVLCLMDATMACVHCGCRVLAKAGTGAKTQLICCDCGHPHSSGPAGLARQPRRSLATTAALMAAFAVTAAGVMTINDHRHSSPLDDEQTLNLNERRQSKESMERKRWSMVARLPAH